MARLARELRERGVPLLLDGAQTIGVRPVDVLALGVDYFAFGAHKGLLGPLGVGGLYVRRPDPEISYCDVGSVNMPALAGMVASMKQPPHAAPTAAAHASMADTFCQAMRDVENITAQGRRWAGEESSSSFSSSPSLSPSSRSATNVVSVTLKGWRSPAVGPGYCFRERPFVCRHSLSCTAP